MPDPLARFRAAVLDDPALQEELCRPIHADAFAALAVEVGARNGLRFGPQDVHAALWAAALARDDAPRQNRHAVAPPPGWLPVEARDRGVGLELDWVYFGATPLREPFYRDSAQRQLRKPFNRLFRLSTPIDALESRQGAHPELKPSGFIFHMSRCGSTLVAQMLAALPRAVVISEASPIDTVVRAHEQRPDLGEDEHAAWLRWIVAALGQPRRGGEQHLFVKLDSWHTLALPLFRRAFPDVPWIFLYRDPIEVLVSQLRQPGLHMVPGSFSSVLGIAPSYATEDHRARVLARICEAVLEHRAAPAGLLVDYRELPDALWTRIMPHFGVTCDAYDRALMAKTAVHDAKTPVLMFSPDSQAKQCSATPAARAAAATWLGDIHDRLERRRLDGL